MAGNILATVSSGDEVIARSIGIPGADGVPGIVWRGAFDLAATYVLHDAVSFNGSSYISISPTDITGIYPTDATKWNPLALAGAAGSGGSVQSETNPIFTASAAFSITSQDIVNWNTAYGWGDWSTAIGTSIQGYSVVLQNTTASYTVAEETKLAGIETGATADQLASEVPVVATGFTGNLSDTDTDVQTALNTIDQLTLGGGSGTVTSVGMTVPVGLTVSGTPITTSGTLTVALDAGYTMYTTTEQTKLSGIETGATADQLASEVPVTPTGNISSTNVQDALSELDTNKASVVETIVTNTGNTLVEDAINLVDLSSGDRDFSTISITLGHKLMIQVYQDSTHSINFGSGLVANSSATFSAGQVWRAVADNIDGTTRWTIMPGAYSA